MLGVHFLLALLGVVNVASGLGEVEVAWALDSKDADDDSASVLNMVCYPAATSCEDQTAVWAVHSVKKTDVDVSERTTINTASYPAWGMPPQYQLGPCALESQVQYAPAVETFSQTYVSTKTLAYTELNGADFTGQTKLVRRGDVQIDGVQGLFGTHDTYELSDNWNLADKSTPDNIPYGESDKFFQQFYMFPQSVQLGPISVEPCDLIHLFFYVRQESTDVDTSADWKFRRQEAAPEDDWEEEEEEGEKEGEPEKRRLEEGFFEVRDFILTGQVALRQVDNETIGVEVEKAHYLEMTRTKEEEVFLPSFTSIEGVEYVRMYEWKSRVYCTSETEITAVPELTEVPSAVFSAALATTVPSAEVEARGLTDLGTVNGARGENGWQIENDWGTWVQRLTFYYIPEDGEPLVYRDEEGQDHIHLNLKWSNLPDKEACPVLVWDPTFHALPAADASSKGSGGASLPAADASSKGSGGASSGGASSFPSVRILVGVAAVAGVTAVALWIP